MLMIFDGFKADSLVKSNRHVSFIRFIRCSIETALRSGPSLTLHLLRIFQFIKSSKCTLYYINTQYQSHYFGMLILFIIFFTP